MSTQGEQPTQSPESTSAPLPSAGAHAAGSEPRPAEQTRNRLLAALVGLMALACIFLAMLLLTPAKAPVAAPAATVTVTANAPQGQQNQQPQQATPSFDAKGFGPLGDRGRHQDNDPLALGEKNAPVTIVEWADYACPFCALWAKQQQPQIVDKYVKQGVARLEWRDLVIFGEKSQRAAQAARAAGMQGKFWEFHQALFDASPTSGHPDLNDAALKAFAEKAGVPDLAKWQKDMESPQVAEAVRKDTAEATAMQANSTPVFIINGVALVGAQPVEVFDRVIQQAAQEQKKHQG